MSQICVHCRKALLRRTTRNGVTEKFVLSLFGYYPWRCAFCKQRQLVRERGEQQPRSRSRTSG